MKKSEIRLFIASCVPDGGIHTFLLSDEGKLTHKSFFRLPEPMYMISSGDCMHILLRNMFGGENSALVRCEISKDGELLRCGELMSTEGMVACHLCEYKGNVYCVNYVSGSVIKMPDKLVCHEGRGPHPTRQESAHTHFVGPTPDGKYLCVTDLGLDKIFLYDENLNKKGELSVPLGHGARHIVFSDCGEYMFVANELESTVSVFKYDGETFELVCTTSCLPEGFGGENTASAIRYRNGKVYVGMRGHDSIAVLDFEDQKLSLEGHILCHGSFVRDFDFAGDFIVCANQNSDSVTVLRNDGDVWTLADEYTLGTPLCVLVG